MFQDFIDEIKFFLEDNIKFIIPILLGIMSFSWFYSYYLLTEDVRDSTNPLNAESNINIIGNKDIKINNKTSKNW